MKKQIKILIVPLLLALLLIGCDDHGLSPVKERPGFGGVISAVPPWAPPDSLFDLRIVAFPTYPQGSILEEISTGKALISETLEFDVATQTYRISAEDVSGTFEYIAVAHQYGPSILEHWRVVGVYTTTGDWNAPSGISLTGDTYLSNINIRIDFYKLPPQPF